MSKQVEGRGALSPVVVFVALVTLVAAITGAVLLTRETPPPPPGPSPGGSATPTPDHTLTDEEAITRFKELDALRIRALEERSVQLLRSIFTPNSPAFERGRKSIKNLLRSEVVVDDLWDLRSVRVTSNSSTEVGLRVRGLSDARFFDEDGNEVTDQAQLERRVVSCSMRLVTEWLLHDCRVTEAQAIEE